MKHFTFLLLLLAGLTSCDPKKSSVRSNPPVTKNPGSVTDFGSNLCAQGQSNIGAIYDNGQNFSMGSSFEDRVKALLSATTSPLDVGSIGSSLTDMSGTGVRFTGTLKLDASGNIVHANSKILIQVYDSIWSTNRITNPNEQPIPLQFDPSSGSTLSGQFNLSTGSGFFIIKDQYGEIRFDGTFNAQSFSGTVSFKNYTSVTGSNAAGVLGQFLINTCGIIQK